MQQPPQAGPTSPGSIPPFATREPERYQARRITTFSESTGKGNSLNETRRITVRIFRDGNQRREEYETAAAGSVAYLDTLTGRFVLLPAEKVYADLSGGSQDSRLNQLQADNESTSSNSLLHENNFSPRYENLGPETVDGRMTVKYRVKASSSTNSAIGSERVIWVDEALGMPVKSELVHTEGERSSRVLMQLTDIRTEVDPTTFALPADYRKVAASQILSMIQAANAVAPSIPGEK